MAYIEKRRRTDGGISARVKWRLGGSRDGAIQLEVFSAGTDAQNLARADGFKKMVDAAGQRWPAGSMSAVEAGVDDGLLSERTTLSGRQYCLPTGCYKKVLAKSWVQHLCFVACSANQATHKGVFFLPDPGWQVRLVDSRAWRREGLAHLPGRPHDRRRPRARQGQLLHRPAIRELFDPLALLDQDDRTLGRVRALPRQRSSLWRRHHQLQGLLVLVGPEAGRK